MMVPEEDGVTTSVYTVVDADIAANSVVTVSGGENAASAFDLDETTAWTGASWGDWMEIDLGADYKLTSLNLRFEGGEENTLAYEVWVKTGEDEAQSVAKDRDFGAEGYTLAFTSAAKNVAEQTNLFDKGLAGRRIVVKLTGGVGAPVITTANVDGFRIVSDVYAADNAAGTVAMPRTLPAHERLSIDGNGTLNVCGLGSSYFRITVFDGADRVVNIKRVDP